MSQLYWLEPAIDHLDAVFRLEALSDDWEEGALIAEKTNRSSGQLVRFEHLLVLLECVAFRPSLPLIHVFLRCLWNYPLQQLLGSETPCTSMRPTWNTRR